MPPPPPPPPLLLMIAPLVRSAVVHGGIHCGGGRVQELRSRVGASSAQSSDMLRQAQRICDEAEERAAAAEKCHALYMPLLPPRALILQVWVCQVRTIEVLNSFAICG